MTKEQAIKIIRRYECNSEHYEACEIAIKALEQSSYNSIKTELKPCEDAISRQAVLDAIDVKAWEFCDYLISKNRNDEQKPVSHFADTLRECVREELPSVNPQPKTGHWIQTNEFFINQDGQFIYKFICSECKSLSYFRKSNKKAIGANVCPNCGCRMIEPQERRNKE